MTKSESKQGTASKFIGSKLFNSVCGNNQQREYKPVSASVGLFSERCKVKNGQACLT